MDFWLQFLPIIIYLLLIIILIIGIILGIKAIITLNKLENIINDVTEKFQILNSFFHIIDYTTDKMSLVTDKLVDKLTGFVSKMLFSKKKKKNLEEDKNE